MKIIKWIVGVFVSLLLLLLLLWGVLVLFFATPEVLTPRVQEAAQKMTKSEVSIKSVKLRLFTSFPNVSLQIDSLRIRQTKDSIGDLLFAKRCRLSVNPFDLLRKRITINNVALRTANIYMYVDSLHAPLKTFNLQELATEEAETTQDTTSSFNIKDYDITLRRLKIDSTNIVIDDRLKRFYTRVENFGADVSMNLTSTRSKLDVKSGFSNIIVWNDGDLLAKRTSLEVKTQMTFDRDSMLIRFDRARMVLNGIDMRARGTLVRDTVANGMMVDISSRLSTPSIGEFLKLIPTSVISEADKVTSEGEVDLKLAVEGLYSDNSLPTITAMLKVEDGMAKYDSRKLALESISCDAYAFVDLNNPQSSYADIKNLHLNTSQILDLTLSGRVNNIVEAPEVDIVANTVINFDRFTEIFPLNEGIVLQGSNESNMTSKFAVADILNSNFANIDLDGESEFKNLKISYDASKFVQDTTSIAYLYMEAKSGRMVFGDKVKEDNTNVRTLRSQVNFTGLGYKAKSGEYFNIEDIELRAGANFDSATQKMNGMGVRGIAKSTTVGVDSLFSSSLESSDISFIITPKREERNATLRTKISSQALSAEEPIYNSKINLSSVDIDLTMQRIEENEETEETEETREKKRDEKRWSRDGTISFSRFDMYSELFPIMIKIPQTQVSIKDETIHLENAQLIIGGSKMRATGYIDKLIEKILINPRSGLSGELAIDAPILNIGEIIDASNRSALMQEEYGEVEESDSLSGAFLVPRRMNFAFNLNAKEVQMYETKVTNFESLATINKGVLSLEKLKVTVIDGEANGSVIYRNIDRENSNVMANLSLQGVNINRIGELVPSVRSMLPMIESFEGIVDLDVKLNSNLNKESEPDISTLCSAMRFKGKNLVVMDSETFADISKSLRFKNKERNLIDSLEVFALVDESRVDVLPFSLTMDRYSFIAGGSQVINPSTFDVDYNYNISIIKSPLPFKAGVDVTGNLEDFKYKITKAKLKKTDFAEQQQIYEEYRNSIDVSSNELQESIDAKREAARAERRALREKLEREQAEQERLINEEEGDDETIAEGESETITEVEAEVTPAAEVAPEVEIQEE